MSLESDMEEIKKAFGPVYDSLAAFADALEKEENSGNTKPQNNS